MDASAISLARENRIPIIVFDIHKSGAFADDDAGRGHLHDHQGRGLNMSCRSQGAREAHARRDGRAEEGIRRPAHRPRLGQPARPGHGRGLWPAHAAEPGRHRERAGAAPADRQRLGQGPRDADREGDPRRGPRPQPAARRPDDPHSDSRADHGAPQRTRQAGAQVRRAGQRRRPQRPPRRHGSR